jgi:hypothetical protein
VRQVVLENRNTGCNSTPFTAPPPWPWLLSKNPTPLIVAVPISLRIEVVGWWSFPHAFRSGAFARAILRRLATLALLAMQPASGTSTTIVSDPYQSAHLSSWMLLSLSDSFQAASRTCSL